MQTRAEAAQIGGMLAAVTCNLLLGGANTFLLNFLRALPAGCEQLSIISTGAVNEHAADFAGLGADVRTGDLAGLIYEDRLAWSYRELSALAPRAVLAALGAESYEMLRLAPPGVARIGLVQADDPAVYEMAARYTDSLDAMVGVSHRIAERMRAMPVFARTRIEAVPYGIAFGPEQPRAALPTGEPLRVLYLGRLIEEQKRISRVIELVRRCEAARVPVRFTITGSGPDEDAVRAALAGSTIATVRPAVPNQDVPALLGEHDVYLLLSDFEGLPLSLLEAMGEGVVPVVSDLPGGMAEAVTAEAGVRVPPGDVAAAQDAIVRLNVDRSRLAALSEAAADRARTHFSAQRMVSQYLSLIDEIAAAHPPRWPATVAIPAPRGVNPWLFSGWRRHVRRMLRKLH